MMASASLKFGNIFEKHLPVIYQGTISECGLASLLMIAGYHGYKSDMQSLRSRFTVSSKGLNFYDLQQIADQMGFVSRAVRIHKYDLERLTLPAILHLHDCHFVVLKKVTAKHVILHDPAEGSVRYTREELSNYFDGVAMELSPSPTFEKSTATNRLWLRHFTEGFNGLWRSLLKVLGITLALEVFANLIPLYMQVIVDDVVVSTDLGLLKTLLLGYIVIICFHAIASLLRSWMMLRIGTLLNTHIQTRVFTHLLRLPVNFFEQRHTGDIISRFGSLHTIQSTLTTNLVSAIVDGFMSIIVLSIMLLYSPYLSLVALAFLSIYGLLRWLRYIPLKHAVRSSISAKATLDTHFLETIRASRSIKLFNRHLLRRDQWLNHLYDYFNKQNKLNYLNINFSELESFFGLVQRGVILYLGAILVINESMSIGYLLAFIAYKDQFVGRIESLILKIIDFFMLQLHVDRLSDIVCSETEKEPELPYLLSKDLMPSVTLRHVGFRYATYEPWVVRDLSFTVKAGEHVVITGESGAGKSTVLSLIMGFHQPQEGTVYIDDTPINKLGISRFREMARCVMQDDHLFSGTLLENISFFDASPDIEHAEYCAKIAEIHSDIVQMKMAYNTLVSDLGASLSSGQKQRILIARALYAKPKILILDESTSHLDVTTEKKIAANIAKLNMTRISISHRSETIQAADREIKLHLIT